MSSREQMAKTSKCAVLKTAIKWKERYCIVTCISYVSREVYRGKNSHEKREKVEILLQVFILSTSLFFFFVLCWCWLVGFICFGFGGSFVNTTEQFQQQQLEIDWVDQIPERSISQDVNSLPTLNPVEGFISYSFEDFCQHFPSPVYKN